MTSYKTTSIVILVIALASGACPRPSPNYCADLPDHNCLDRDASAPVPPMDSTAPPCAGDTDCANSTVCYLPKDGPGSCVQCTASNSSACNGTMPICGNDNRCRACVTNTECPSDACLPNGSCAQEDDVGYVYQNGKGDCTRNSPCGTLQNALDKPAFPYIRASGSLGTSTTTTIKRDVAILGDTGSELVFSYSMSHPETNPALKIDKDNVHVEISNFRITVLMAGQDSIQILRMNPTIKLTHVSIDSGSGNGISTSDNNNLSATDPDITLTDIAIREKGMSGIYMNGGRLTVIQSSIFSNSNDVSNINNAGIFTTGHIDGSIDNSSISNNQHGNGITIQGGKFTINRSLILNNGNWGISCTNISSGDVMISRDTIITGNANPQDHQTNGC